MAGRVLGDRTQVWDGGVAPGHTVLAKAVLTAMAAAAAVVVLTAGVLLFQGWRYQGRVDPGVEAGGIALGGLSQAEASRVLSERLPQQAPQQVLLEADGKSWSISASALNIQFDADTTAARAYALGHSGNLWTNSGDLLSSWLKGRSVPFAYSIDQQATIDALRQVAPEVARAPVDASYQFDKNGSLAIDPGSAGVAIDSAGTYGAIERSVAGLSSDPVKIQTVTLPQSIQAKDLQPGLSTVQSLVSKPVTISFQSEAWQIAPSSLRAMLQLTAEGQAPRISSDLLTTYLTQLTGDIQSPGVNAGVRWDGSKFSVVPSEAAQAFDPAATAETILNGLKSGQRQFAAVTRATPAAIADADAQAVAEHANQLVQRPFSVTWDSGSLTLPADVIAHAISFKPQSSGDQKLTMSFDESAVADALGTVKSKIEQPAKDAQFRYLNGKVTVTAPEQAGVTLDVAQSAAAVRDALLKGSGSAAIVTKSVEPKYTAAMAGSIVIKDKLASGQTSYAGSISNRAYNVELAVKRVNGALIPPGAVFSFTGTIGAVDTANGYKVGYGIESTTNGSVTTVPSVGGGICQVATTLFHAAFWAGMPIVDRSWHLYWIPNYGIKPDGLTGLDATVDTDAGLDLKFKNPTDNWLAVVASADGSWVRFQLWGTDPGWDVKVADPVVTNVVKADTTMKYQQSDSMPKGQSILLEHAEDGFDVVIHRQVFSDGKLIDDLNLKSHYVPSENITLQGTG